MEEAKLSRAAKTTTTRNLSQIERKINVNSKKKKNTQPTAQNRAEEEAAKQ
jgi:hypothetical protein